MRLCMRFAFVSKSVLFRSVSKGSVQSEYACLPLAPDSFAQGKLVLHALLEARVSRTADEAVGIADLATSPVTP